MMERNDLIERLTEFLNEFCKRDLIEAVSEGRKFLQIDFSLIDKFDIELADYLIENPEETIEAAEEAAKQIETGMGETELRLRFYNIPESREVRIRNIRSEHVGKMIAVEGFVKRASEVRPEVSEAIFQCAECGNKITVIQTERIIRSPTECESCDNRRNFKLMDQKLYDARWITIEEPSEITSGERPSNIMVYLKEDLTSPKMHNKTDPGNRIKVVGILKQMPKRFKGTHSRQMDIYIEANSLETIESEWEELEISQEDEQKIIEMANDPMIYQKLVQTIAPALYGMEEIKEAISLQLFGGVTKFLRDRTRIRGDIHLLLVGDPSTAKSSLMKVVANLIPRGRYVSGKGVTAAGLTATVTKDEEFLGGWVLEAGALVMCNRSLISIDEFEKVEKSDQVSLHEAMEQQTISIAKANIVATLPAQTSILAGANPKLGRFDQYLPIKEQIDIPETLLSRFDMKFALRDLPNPEVDAKIADHIMRTRFFRQEDAEPVIKPDMIKKYVAYARKNCKPEMSEEAANELRNFYLTLRERSGEESPIAITPRQYEALIRLAEASAKVQLRNNVTVEDAQRAINLMKSSLRQFGFEPETGKYDIDRMEGAKSTAAQRSKIRVMIDVIDDISRRVGKDVPVEDLLKQARQEGLENAEDILRKMLNEGLIFQPRQGYINKL
jgi:replicative DNA helicase Mcm